MNPLRSVQKILRAARAQTQYASHRWDAGILDIDENPLRPFKLGHVPPHSQTPLDDELDDKWSGDIERWDYALKHARVGHRIDFYVYSTGPSGELVTNVGVLIESPTRAVVCDCGGKPFVVEIPA